MTVFLIFQLAVLLFSVIIHEVSHGYAAEQLGDPTARLAGRLTLNPASHFSFFGMVIFPILSYFAWGIPVGGAKPVPYNPLNLKDPRKGGALIAVAGPASNLILALVFGIILRLTVAGDVLPPPFADLLGTIVYLNILLAIFNLVPVPPLDGSKVISFVLRGRLNFYWENFWNKFLALIQQNRLLFLVLFVFFFQYVLYGIFFVIDPIIKSLFFLITGQPFGF